MILVFVGVAAFIIGGAAGLAAAGRSHRFMLQNEPEAIIGILARHHSRVRLRQLVRQAEVGG
jgi:hypothetical protein